MIDYKPRQRLEYGDYIASIFPEDKRKIKTLTFQVTEDCCLKCTYCYQINKSRNYMPFEVAKEFLDKLFDNYYPELTEENTKGFILDFIGGEPLMAIDLIEQICDYYFELAKKNSSEWLLFTMINICSNGILYFDDKVQNFFNKYRDYLSFCISIDGNKELHDACRIDFNNKGSYDRAMKAVRHFRENFPEKTVETKMTLSPFNISHTYEALVNLINEGYEIIPCNCIYEKGWELEHAQILYKELKKVADYLIDNDLYNKVNVRLFREDSYCPMSPEDNQNYCGGVGDTMTAIDYRGNIFHCIRFMESSLNGEQPPFVIGTVKHGLGFTEEEQAHIKACNEVTRRSQSTDECFNCPVATGCGLCSGYCYQVTGNVNSRVTYICVMHKATTLANVYYWNKLYRKLSIDKTFINHLKDEDALQIIGKDELDFLKRLEGVNI